MGKAIWGVFPGHRLLLHPAEFIFPSGGLSQNDAVNAGFLPERKWTHGYQTRRINCRLNPFPGAKHGRLAPGSTCSDFRCTGHRCGGDSGRSAAASAGRRVAWGTRIIQGPFGRRSRRRAWRRIRWSSRRGAFVLRHGERRLHPRRRNRQDREPEVHLRQAGRLRHLREERRRSHAGESDRRHDRQQFLQPEQQFLRTQRGRSGGQGEQDQHHGRLGDDERQRGPTASSPTARDRKSR